MTRPDETTVWPAPEVARAVPRGMASRVHAAQRHLVSVLSSYRVRLVAWFALLMALGTAASVLLVGMVLLDRIDERIERDLAQEVDEFRRLATGNDPATGQPFGTDVARIFEVFIDRNIPAVNETVVTYLGGTPYRSSAVGAPYQLASDQAFHDQVAAVAEPAAGRYQSPAGAVDYVAIPVRIDGRPAGVFAVAVFRDVERAHHDDILLAGGAVGGALVIIGSLLAWRLADRVLAPVREATTTARAITDADLSRRVDVHGRDEIGQLVTTLNAMLDRLESAAEAQREFMQDVGHELRTPLTIVQGHLELLDEGPSEERPRTLALVMDELERIGRLVNDLGTLALANRPDFVQRGVIDAGRLVTSVVEKGRVLGKRSWSTEIRWAGTVPADGQRITQAMLQLIHNAIRHTSPGDDVVVGCDAGASSVTFWVRDTGPGIPEDQHDRIFERFHRLERRDPGRGSGLGLAIVRAIAEAHGGSATVRSREGAGATFLISLPLASRPEQEVRT